MTQQKRKIRFFDTTLRDGEQAPGCSMNLRDKLLVAEQLELLKVDVIEAGFAISSPGDFESVKAIAGQVKQASVASLARALEKDIDAAWGAVSCAAHPRIHVFLATSPLHRQYKLKMTKEEVVERAVRMVAYARNLCPEIQFSLEDATRTEPDFRNRVVEAVIKAGASVVNLPDTVGYSTPDEMGAMIRDVLERVPNADKASLAIHCHNDLGLAVANTVAALKAGAQQAECTINGIGERAGNAAIEEIAMIVKTRHDLFEALDVGLDTTKIYAASRCVQNVTGVSVQPNKAIVGKNAFAHESGIHQHGVMANASTYEIMTPESIGISRTQMVLGKHSGRHAFEQRLEDLGFHLSDEQIAAAFAKFKALADRKKVIDDADIEALAHGHETTIPEHIRLERFSVQAGNVITPTSTVRIVREDGKVFEEVALGDGPIDASFRAINAICKLKVRLERFNISAVTEGREAQGSTSVRVRDLGTGRVHTGRGLATDIVESAILAYLQALNGIYADTLGAKQPQ
ncbi:MAG: 2-isopropylmalate synthase [Kiritimatiellia bacterium]|nr:2-isopropylmalate synthase [Kiritimatiellia bacterium]